MKETVTVHFILPNGSLKTVEANVGETVLQVAHLHDLPLEGACGGSLACSTCHVLLDEEYFNDKDISEDENDMLDLVMDLKSTSRLGCQIILNKNMDGIKITIPSDSKNFNGNSKCCHSEK